MYNSKMGFKVSRERPIYVTHGDGISYSCVTMETLRQTNWWTDTHVQLFGQNLKI